MDEKCNIFVDESGIGRRVGYSVYCLVFCSKRDSSILDNEVLKIENDLRIAPFHWREQSWNIKIKFLKRILRINQWLAVICVIDNKLFSYKSPEEIIAKGLFGVNIETMYIDGKKTKNYVFSLKRSLKDLNINISKLKLVTSSSFGGLRIADAVAGLFRLSLEKKVSHEVSEILQRLNKKITTQIVSGYLPNPPHGR